MRSIRLYIPILFVAVSLFACRKDKELRSGSCQQLYAAAMNMDIQQAREAITNYIAGLPSQAYTEANLVKLVQAINSGLCTGTASLFCFDCIQTLPAQSEIFLSLGPGGIHGQAVIDISSDGANNMVFRNLHQ